MHRLFIGLFCFLFLYGLCGCAAFNDTFSRSGQESAPQESTPQVCLLDPASCIPQTPSPAVAPDKTAPIVQIPETSYDFGILREDTELVHKFLIKNVGASELIIKKVSPG
ncbi:conserved exported hypothetical protein [Syntrophobacter sp. SbD2]|nr:conserved exported hypothetical protein [Syntrophobacter sp. SbD2]